MLIDVFINVGVMHYNVAQIIWKSFIKEIALLITYESVIVPRLQCMSQEWLPFPSMLTSDTEVGVPSSPVSVRLTGRLLRHQRPVVATSMGQ